MTTPTPTSPRPDQFVIEVPEHWAHFGLSDDELARSRARTLKSARTPVERIQAEDLFRQARALIRAARRRGALWGAGTATVYDDGLFMGHLMVFAVSVPPGQQFTPSMMVRAGDNADVHPRTVTTVDLPHVGEAARIYGTERVSVTKQDQVDMLAHHTFVPVPGAEGQFFLVSAASPNVPLAESVYDLFDAIVSTFRFFTTDSTGTEDGATGTP